MITVGYSNHHKGWKLYDPKTQRIVVSNNVQFENETTPFNGVHKSIPSLTDSLSQPYDSGLRGNTDEIPETTSINPESTAESNNTPNIISTSQSPLVETEGTTSTEELTNNNIDSEFDDDDLDPLTANLSMALLVSDDAPLYHEAMQRPDKGKWEIAIEKEYKSLALNKVFSRPIQLPKGHTALDTTMVLKLKEAEVPNGPRRYKARLCGKGFRQTHGVNYFETYAPVVTYSTLRITLTLFAILDYEIDTIDVTTAFLLSPIKGDVFIKIPSGYPCKPGEEKLVLKLQKCLYGLKQAPIEWNNELDLHLKSYCYGCMSIY
jgi:hypothetical protein